MPSIQKEKPSYHSQILKRLQSFDRGSVLFMVVIEAKSLKSDGNKILPLSKL